MTLRVATYNVHGCVGGDRCYDEARIIEVLRELDADVVGLQEVWLLDEQHRRFLSRAEKALSMSSHFGRTLEAKHGVYGNALLCRAHVSTVENLDLSVPRREPRAALLASLTIHGEPLCVCVTHFGLTRAERAVQARRLCEHLAGRARGVTLLLGDTNIWAPREPAAATLRHTFGPARSARSFPATWPVFAIDRVAAYPPQRLLSTSAHRSATARLASDHLPVTAEIDL